MTISPPLPNPQEAQPCTYNRLAQLPPLITVHQPPFIANRRQSKIRHRKILIGQRAHAFPFPTLYPFSQDIKPACPPPTPSSLPPISCLPIQQRKRSNSHGDAPQIMVGPSSTGAGRGLFVALNPGVDRTVLPKGTPIGGYSKAGTWERESSGDKCVAYAFSGLEVGVFFEKELVSLLEAVRVLAGRE
jgi:hypothetical protein